MIRISKVSKLDGIRSWSLQARETCPGAINQETGQLADACAGCYASFGQYLYSNVKEPRQENKEDWRSADWEDRMVAEVSKYKYFRWFDSGDMYSLRLAYKIYKVMVRCSNTKFWLPTRMYKFEKFQGIINKMNELPNVVVRFSSDSITGEFQEGIHGSTIIPYEGFNDNRITPCKAYENDGKCSGCRQCWDKNVSVIGYLVHGRVAKSKLKKKFVLIPV